MSDEVKKLDTLSLSARHLPATRDMGGGAEVATVGDAWGNLNGFDRELEVPDARD